MTLYINTNNNIDRTEEILRQWVERVGDQYRKVVFENHEVDVLASETSRPHAWNAVRFQVLGEIRQKSLEKTLECGCDYYFVVDCDNFIVPQTLQTLIARRKPIIAPLLQSIPQPNLYSNFFCAIDENGYYRSHPLYFDILNRSIQGTFRVPVIHCCYLVDAKWISHLTYVDGSNDYEFVIFSKSARRSKIGQFLCNEEEFGYVLQLDGSGTMELEEEVELFQKLEISLGAHCLDPPIDGDDSSSRPC